MMVAILIHALQTESDVHSKEQFRFIVSFQSTLSKRRATTNQALVPHGITNFNPRSPSGERHNSVRNWFKGNYFNPRSPSGERPNLLALILDILNFNPRSPSGERRTQYIIRSQSYWFQSTLSKRRATTTRSKFITLFFYFNPRSPSGERQRFRYFF